MSSSLEKFCRQNYAWLLGLILVFAFGLRVWNLHSPTNYIFDEVYHGVTAKLIAKNDPRAFEWWHGPVEPNTAIDWLHPPLAKYTQALGINIFGANSFGWRVSSTVFGTLTILLIAHLTKLISNNHALALTAALLASSDGLLLVQSRIAMNDIHVTFFILLTICTYIQYVKNRNNQQPAYGWLLAAGLAAGLALASKWSGVFVVAVLWISEVSRIILYKLTTPKSKNAFNWPQLLITAFSFSLLPLLIYLLAYAPMFAQGKNWQHFYQLHQQIWRYQTHLDATHTYQSRPWQWFLNLRPVWFYVYRPNNNINQIANIYSQGNTVLYWLGGLAAVSSSIFFLAALIKRNYGLLARYFNIGIVLLTYWLVWLPWQLSPRIMFFYHYTPAVPFLSIVLAWSIWQLPTNWRGLSIRTPFLFITACLSLIFCALWLPNWLGTPVPTWWAEYVYFAIPSWR